MSVAVLVLNVAYQINCVPKPHVTATEWITLLPWLRGGLRCCRGYGVDYVVAVAGYGVDYVVAVAGYGVDYVVAVAGHSMTNSLRDIHAL